MRVLHIGAEILNISRHAARLSDELPKKKQCTPVTSANLDNISKQIVHEKK
jgi:hypothetical protein